MLRGCKSHTYPKMPAHFSAPRIERIIRNGRYSPRLAKGVSATTAAIVETLMAQLLRQAAKAAGGKRNITPDHFRAALHANPDLARFFNGVVMVPPTKRPSKKKKKAAVVAEAVEAAVAAE